ncbi:MULTISPECIES: (2Fe-2S)-binding protein [Thermomonospora]|uniref:Bacterioferritin-associated ferredoxin n=1 Tax=Thermomonospora cellulosilytica TaxID=1411118 RepID=A0A7W3RD65_9ACTN|nr:MULTISPECIES: (2Fe-2S)-binding protein [Thermomonospora]MBA9007995.1 bacterioferritin-associated ferredoxin [Thermomonospora cellulosilytica]
MYVCICNGVTEEDVLASLAAGAGTTREVKAACGWKPGCGVCTRRLCGMVAEHRRARETDVSLPLETMPPAHPATPGPEIPVPLGMPAVRQGTAA